MEKKAEKKYDFMEAQVKKYKKPTVVQFPVLVMPFTGN